MHNRELFFSCIILIATVVPRRRNYYITLDKLFQNSPMTDSCNALLWLRVKKITKYLAAN